MSKWFGYAMAVAPCFRHGVAPPDCVWSSCQTSDISAGTRVRRASRESALPVAVAS